MHVQLSSGCIKMTKFVDTVSVCSDCSVIILLQHICMQKLIRFFFFFLTIPAFSKNI